MQFTLKLTGDGPLLMHNSRLANPMNPIAKALKTVSAKTRKTDADHLEMSRLEFLGGLYIDPDLGPYIPGPNIECCLKEAARMSKLGKQVERGVFVTQLVNPLAYRGPRAEAELWEDENFRRNDIVRVGQARVVRTRAEFRGWALETRGVLDVDQLTPEKLEEIAAKAGLYIGLGDWRPNFGRFTAEVSFMGADDK